MSTRRSSARLSALRMSFFHDLDEAARGGAPLEYATRLPPDDVACIRAFAARGQLTRRRR